MIHRIYQLSISLIKIASVLFFQSNCKDTSKIGVGSTTKFSIDTMVQPFVANKDTRALSVAVLRDGKTNIMNMGLFLRI